MGLPSDDEMRKASDFYVRHFLKRGILILHIYYVAVFQQHLLGNDTNITGRLANVIKAKTSLKFIIAAVRTQSTILF